MTLPLLTSFITKLIRKITLNRVLVWSFTALTVILFYTLYENKTQLVSHFTTPSITNMVGVTFDVSKETRAQAQLTVEGDKSIVGISIMSADLRLNQAHGVFYFSDDAVVSDVLYRAERAGSNRMPIFTTSDSHNGEMVKLINGTFSCAKFSTTLSSKIYPELSSSIKTVCRSGIPSYYGYFSGYVEVYLSEEVVSEKTMQLELIIEGLADAIYFDDVIPTQRPEKMIGQRRF